MSNEPAATALGDGGLVRLRLDIGYDGTGFSGWAVQPGRRTVCATVQDALGTVFRRPVRLAVAGRTDAGVHAISQVAHCDVPRSVLADRSIGGDPGRLVRRLAKLLPEDVRVKQVTEVSTDFDARFSALRRHYRYRLTDTLWGAEPVRLRDTAVWQRRLDVSVMNEAAADLLGLNDFAAFCRYREGATTIRELQRFDWLRDDDGVLVAQVSADAFCWNMVRSLVGAVAVVGDGRRDRDWLRSLLTATARHPQVIPAPARGLCLVGVDYPSPEQWAARNAVTRDVRDTPTGCCGD